VLRGMLRQKSGSESSASPSSTAGTPPREALRSFLGILADQGEVSPGDAVRAYADGIAALQKTGRFPSLTAGDASLPPSSERSLKNLYGILVHLQQYGRRERSAILQAAMAVMAADGVMTWQEATLLRMIGAGLDLPIPPVLPDVVPSSESSV